MTAFAMTVPYRRTSPVRVPRRDLTLGGVDSLLLAVSVIEYDNPAAALLDTSASGSGSPNLKMLVWPDQYRNFWDYGYGWDYGIPYSYPQRLLWSGVGAASQTIPGTFNISFPTATMATWPRRCSFALQLDWDDGSNTELLTHGSLHIVRSATVSGDSGTGSGPPPIGTLDVLATDADVAVLTDLGQYILLN